MIQGVAWEKLLLDRLQARHMFRQGKGASIFRARTSTDRIGDPGVLSYILMTTNPTTFSSATHQRSRNKKPQRENRDVCMVTSERDSAKRSFSLLRLSIVLVLSEDSELRAASSFFSWSSDSSLCLTSSRSCKEKDLATKTPFLFGQFLMLSFNADQQVPGRG